MNKNIQLKKYASFEKLSFAVSIRCEYQLQKVLSQDGKASFIIPGGTTPASVFSKLSQSSLDWKNITIGQSDERWLPSEHSQSNLGLTSKTLLINNAKNANYIAMKNSHTKAISGEAECNKAYEKLARPFSLTMLGMGTDGHIASLFPNSKTIEQAMDKNNSDLCIAIDATDCQVAGDYPERMSLTLSAILNSQLIILLITGEEKLSVIEQAMKNNQPEILPVSALVNQKNTPVEIYWCQ